MISSLDTSTLKCAGSLTICHLGKHKGTFPSGHAVIIITLSSLSRLQIVRHWCSGVCCLASSKQPSSVISTGLTQRLRTWLALELLGREGNMCVSIMKRLKLIVHAHSQSSNSKFQRSLCEQEVINIKVMWLIIPMDCSDCVSYLGPGKEIDRMSYWGLVTFVCHNPDAEIKCSYSKFVKSDLGMLDASGPETLVLHILGTKSYSIFTGVSLSREVYSIYTSKIHKL